MKWRRAFATAAPKEIRRWWATLLANKHVELQDLCNHRALCHALLQLLAAADEASEGAGLPTPPSELDDFDLAAGTLLRRHEGSTLCDALSSAPIRVLPKMRVPQTGFTIRSFSKHLALISGKEILPKWFTLGPAMRSPELNILIVPWPKKISPTDFVAVKSKDGLMKNLPKNFGFFEFRHENGSGFATEVIKLFQDAHEAVGDIHAVILPECAISDAEYDEINSILLSQGVTLIAGVSAHKNDEGPSANCVRYNIPVVGHEVPVRQAKHHRWKLERSQIDTYRLQNQLNPKRSWWEHIPIEDRTLNFVAYHPWLTMCALICEDLARPDPVGDVIRAVGPNLVIALLLDGPQLPNRWPSRYATVLAEDPGCSVLTLTSSGMAKLSRPRYKRGYKAQTNIVASWRDVRGITLGIDLKGGDAAVLGIKVENREEWTADGRDCGKQAGYPLLHWIYVLRDGRAIKRYDLRD